MSTQSTLNTVDNVLNSSTVGSVAKAIPVVGTIVSIAGPVVHFVKGLFGNGSQYSSQQLRLGERFLHNVQGQNVTSYHSVSDDVVPQAVVFFTQMLGVRVYDNVTLDNLKAGVAQYYSQDPVKYKDIPQAAVERAHGIMAGAWSDFNALGGWRVENLPPYVAPIPSIEPGGFYNGQYFRGGNLKNGYLEGNYAEKNVPTMQNILGKTAPVPSPPPIVSPTSITDVAKLLQPIPSSITQATSNPVGTSSGGLSTANDPYNLQSVTVTAKIKTWLQKYWGIVVGIGLLILGFVFRKKIKKMMR